MSQLLEHEVAEVHYDPDCTPGQVAEVLTHLERWSNRTGKHVTHHRQHERFDYPAEVIVGCVNKSNDSTNPAHQVFHVQARNISQAGLGFLAPPLFVPRLLSDATPLVRTESIFRIQTPVTIRLSSRTSEPIHLSAVIQRQRPVHLGFMEIGVKFLSRCDAFPEIVSHSL